MSISPRRVPIKYLVFVSLIVLAVGGFAVAGTGTAHAADAPFTDVNPSDGELWSAAWYVKEAGIFEGSNGSLGAWSSMTRRHVALVLERANLGSRGEWKSDYRAATREEVRQAFPTLDWKEDRGAERVLRSQVVRLIYRGRANRTFGGVPAPSSVLNVRDFGARGDGQTDDTRAFEQAFAQVAPGQGVYIPAGTYRVGRVVLWKKSKVTVYGDGDASVLVSNAPESILEVLESSEVVLRDFAIRGSYAQTHQLGVGFRHASRAQVLRVKVTDVGFAGFLGSMTDTLFSEVTVRHAGDFGLQTKPGSARVTIENSRFEGFASRTYPGHAVYIQGTPGAVVKGNHISGVDDAPGKFEVSGIKITDGSAGTTVEGNVVEDSFTAVSVPYARGTVVRNNVGRRLEERGYYVLAGSSNVLFEGNRVEQAPIGFRLRDSSGVTLRGNQVSGVSTALDSASVSGLTQSGNSWQ